LHRTLRNDKEVVMKLLKHLQEIQGQVKIRDFKEKEIAEHHHDSSHGGSGMGFAGEKPLTVDAFGHTHIGDSPFNAHLQSNGTWHN